nr:MAG TPA: hypothetical protein [Caudoviricetes sp.]
MLIKSPQETRRNALFFVQRRVFFSRKSFYRAQELPNLCVARGLSRQVWDSGDLETHQTYPETSHVSDTSVKTF